MGEARYNILVKSKQLQMLNYHFQHKQMMDTVNLDHFTESSENLCLSGQ